MFINPVWEYQLHNGVEFSSIFEHIKGMGAYSVEQATVERDGERIEFELNNGHWFCLEYTPNTNGKFVFFGFDDEQICDEMDISPEDAEELKDGECMCERGFHRYGCAFDEDGTAIRELIVTYANDCGICDY